MHAPRTWPSPSLFSPLSNTVSCVILFPPAPPTASPATPPSESLSGGGLLRHPLHEDTWLPGAPFMAKLNAMASRPGLPFPPPAVQVQLTRHRGPSLGDGSRGALLVLCPPPIPARPPARPALPSGPPAAAATCPCCWLSRPRDDRWFELWAARSGIHIQGQTQQDRPCLRARVLYRRRAAAGREPCSIRRASESHAPSAGPQ